MGGSSTWRIALGLFLVYRFKFNSRLCHHNVYKGNIMKITGFITTLDLFPIFCGSGDPCFSFCEYRQNAEHLTTLNGQ